MDRPGPARAALSEGTPGRPVTLARGRTTLAPLVVERLAVQACRELYGGSPKAVAQLDGRIARLNVTAAVPYPAAIRPAARQMRARIVELVERLADVDAREVDVVVGWLLQDLQPSRRVR